MTDESNDRPKIQALGDWVVFPGYSFRAESIELVERSWDGINVLVKGVYCNVPVMYEEWVEFLENCAPPPNIYPEIFNNISPSGRHL